LYRQCAHEALHVIWAASNQFGHVIPSPLMIVPKGKEKSTQAMKTTPQLVQGKGGSKCVYQYPIVDQGCMVNLNPQPKP
jgi:hypothetical protein